MAGLTSTESLSRLHFDPSGLIEVFGEDHSFLSEFVGLFCEQSTLLLGEIQAACNRNDGLQVERSSHTLKGMLANLGQSVALDLSAQLELLGVQRDLEETSAMIPVISREIQMIQADLERLWG